MPVVHIPNFQMQVDDSNFAVDINKVQGDGKPGGHGYFPVMCALHAAPVRDTGLPGAPFVMSPSGPRDALLSGRLRTVPCSHKLSIGRSDSSLQCGHVPF